VDAVELIQIIRTRNDPSIDALGRKRIIGSMNDDDDDDDEEQEEEEKEKQESCLICMHIARRRHDDPMNASG
jgi:hypothetical protein